MRLVALMESRRWPQPIPEWRARLSCHGGRRGERDGNRQAQGIDQQMALTPLHLLVGVVAADAGRFLDSLRTLAVHDRRAWVRVAADAFALGTMQGAVEQVPRASQAKAANMVGGRLLGRELDGR
jgi:hypothetical protein